ncbi:glycosyl hydrolase family 28 protein [uncultured Draconibacterium sp.]|uniref:glycoside hydrolase family 28 protein n=1 Tax=uncultured Draconibacterium sp. TaxID=1573823 RepID=UPI003260A725
MNLKQLGCITFMFLLTLAVSGKQFNVYDFGAMADGKTLDTKAVQAAIDACTQNGGGQVVIPAGKTVLVGTIYLKDFVNLHIETGAVLLGSPHIEDYATDTHKIMYKRESHMDRCLIYAENASSFAIEGYGTIDGNGAEFTNQRPMLLRFKDCNNIHLNDITLKNPAAWTSAFLYCNEIAVSGIRISSWANKNGDGLDFDGCTNVRVANCSFSNSDDSICLQASLPNKPCRDVVVTNCIFETKWGGMRIGLLSRGNIEQVAVSNCTFKNIEDSGLKIQQCEGGEMRNMTFTNLVMENVPRPVFMTFSQQRACVDVPEGTYEPLNRMHNMIFSNIVVDNRKLDKNSCFFFTGYPGNDIENVVLKDVQFTISGGATAEDAAKEVKEYSLEVVKKHWPEFYLVGTLPASALYARHLDGLYVENFHVFIENEDARKPFILNDVKNGSVEKFYVNKKQIN